VLEIFEDVTPIENPGKPLGSVYPWGAPPWRGGGIPLVDLDEYLPELAWPWSVQVFPEMLNDTQVDSLWTGISYPIQSWRWYIDQGDADAEMTAKLAEDLGLGVSTGEDSEIKDPPRKRRRKFSFSRHLADALRAVYMGHYFFETWGNVTDGMWRMEAIAARPPKTVNQIRVDQAGELISIQQNLSMFEPQIPASVLVPYVWDREGANWFGRSILRSSYGAWRLKQRLMNIDRIKHERNALGVAVAKAMQGASTGDLQKAQEMASAVRAGDEGGVALPFGYDLSLEGVKGSTSTPLDSVRYYDEVMARRLFQMLSMLGTTATGNRAIGAEFRDLLDLGLETIGKWVAESFTEDFIEKWWTWNVGEDEPCPSLCFDASSILTMDVLGNLVTSGALMVDDGLEAYIRESHNLPARTVTREAQKTAEAPPPPVVVAPDAPPAGAPPAKEDPAKPKVKVEASEGTPLLDVDGNPVVTPDGDAVLIGPDGRAFLASRE
jgi:hypothetical protein